jgi:hypothetical protein
MRTGLKRQELADDTPVLYEYRTVGADVPL